MLRAGIHIQVEIKNIASIRQAKGRHCSNGGQGLYGHRTIIDSGEESGLFEARHHKIPVTHLDLSHFGVGDGKAQYFRIHA